MNLYLVKREDGADYDEYDAFVVRANNEQEALGLAVKSEPCFTEKNVTTTLIGTAYGDGLEPGTVLGSYNAG